MTETTFIRCSTYLMPWCRCALQHGHGGNHSDDGGALGIGDRSRDGLLEITDTRWDDNAGLRVTVRELIGQQWTARELRRARDLARRALVLPKLTHARRVRTWWAQDCSHVTFVISR